MTDAAAPRPRSAFWRWLIPGLVVGVFFGAIAARFVIPRLFPPAPRPGNADTVAR